MCQGRHHLITISRNSKLGIAYCLLGIFMLFIGCAQQNDAPFEVQDDNNQPIQTEIIQDESLVEMPSDSDKASPNQHPIILSDPVTQINVDQPYVYTAIAIDPDGDTLSWLLIDQISGLNINQLTGIIYGSNLNPGTHNIQLSVQDELGANSEQQFTLTVTQNPTIHSLAPKYTFTGYKYIYQILATSVDDTNLIYTLDTAPSGMIINEITGKLEWENPVKGDHQVNIKVNSASGNTTNQEFVLSVLDENSLLITSNPEVNAYASHPYQYKPSILSITELERTFTLIGAAPGMVIDKFTGHIRWTPSNPGIYHVEIMVVDTDGRKGNQVFEIQARSLEEIDAEINEVIQNIFDNFVANDINFARNFMSGEAQANYLPVFNALLPHMEEIVANLDKMERVTINKTSAEYIIPRTLNNETRLYLVTFVTDSDGSWKLNSL
jgi:hypothetical protein